MLACIAFGKDDLRVQDWPAEPPGPGQVSVDIAYGGICGSDLHYYHRGGVGDFVIREPLVLGHEVAGRVRELGPGVTGPEPGTPVAIHPATPCGRCPECAIGRRNICRDTRYLGSAARFPHVQGGFRSVLTVPVAQAIPLPDGLGLRQAVLAEPLSVAMHAVRRLGPVEGRQVLVTGSGPIGCLAVAALGAAGAGAVVASDLFDEALAVGSAVGATATVRADDPAADWPDEVDAAIEASGTAAGLAACVERVRRGGTVVQLGLLPPGGVPLLGNRLVTREITLAGAFRFDTEFSDALAALGAGLAVGPVITASYPITAAADAFRLAGDRRRACKVLLDISS
ncbi:MAG TPA: L-idonate 5-dehydrogenase [Trebonia sp.]|nr:L-idonate 5-dehydrogenase [Trebonia sp.]